VKIARTAKIAKTARARTRSGDPWAGPAAAPEDTGAAVVVGAVVVTEIMKGVAATVEVMVPGRPSTR
jgi:hypothetical protein